MDLQALETVSALLNEGIVSICNICKSLLDSDPKTGMCSNYKQIREHIEHAEQCLNKSEKMCEEKLKCLDECMEKPTKEKEKVEQQNKEKRKTMGELHIEMKSAEESLKHSEAALEEAEKIVALRKDEIKRETGRKNTGKGVAIAGAVLTPIPLLGFIAGSIMMIAGGSVIAVASKAIRDAEDELKKNESQVKENSNKVSNYHSSISTIQNEIKETEKVLNKFQKGIEEVKQHLKVTADFQEIVRKAVRLLSDLSGKVTVLEKQTQCFILWGPVVNVMKAVMKAVVNVAENRLLCNQGVPAFINALRENVGGLALCNSAQNSEHDSYY
ncbi:peptidoglycan DL-endopeptidase CwlO [Chanodichthys erythropterus]|uniref:peptidoglycan DL-endopeptidase CwlO n=1 Tax=Chanodichthys erythropterus TaxID=933992 RepID=UPI00351F473A